MIYEKAVNVMLDFYNGKLDCSDIEAKMQELCSKLNLRCDLKWIAKAFYVGKKKKGKKDYYNSSLATLGDAVLKLILTEKFYDEGKTKGEITDKRIKEEKNETLVKIRNKYELLKYAYNENFFYNDVKGKHEKLPNSGHDLYVEALFGAVFKSEGISECYKLYKQMF